MTAREVQWQSKLNHMRGYGPVHKWEKRWISKGSMMVRPTPAAPRAGVLAGLVSAPPRRCRGV